MGAAAAVLVVDDEVTVTEMVKEILVSAGYTVATANTMSDALARAEDMLPDAIVLGLRLARSMNNSLLMEFRSRFRHASLLVTSACLAMKFRR